MLKENDRHCDNIVMNTVEGWGCQIVYNDVARPLGRNRFGATCSSAKRWKHVRIWITVFLRRMSRRSWQNHVTFTAFCCAGSARCFKSGLLPKSYQREPGNCPKRFVSGEARVGCASSHPASPNPKKKHNHRNYLSPKLQILQCLGLSCFHRGHLRFFATSPPCGEGSGFLRLHLAKLPLGLSNRSSAWLSRPLGLVTLCHTFLASSL